MFEDKDKDGNEKSQEDSSLEQDVLGWSTYHNNYQRQKGNANTQTQK